eukprot:scaffold6710_cov175-Amphora_coffeaeformis.AAC.6
MEALFLSAGANFFCHPHCGSAATAEDKAQHGAGRTAAAKSTNTPSWKTPSYTNQPAVVHHLTYSLIDPDEDEEDGKDEEDQEEEEEDESTLFGEQWAARFNEENSKASRSQCRGEDESTLFGEKVEDESTVLGEKWGEDESALLGDKRGVRFNEMANRLYVNRYDDTMIRWEDLWYTENEISDFRRDHREIIYDLRYMGAVLDHAPNSWSKAYEEAYQRFCEQGEGGDNTATTANVTVSYDSDENDDSSQSSPSPPKPLLCDPHTAGLERKAIRAISVDTTDRREQLYEAVFYWQDAPLRNEAVRQHMIAREAFQISRPSRLYAAHVAAISAETLLDE